MKRRRRPLVYAIIILLFVLRIFLAMPRFEITDVGYYRDLEQNLKLEGVVSTEPDIRSDSIYAVVETRSLMFRERSYEVSGKVLLKLRRYPEYEYGDLLRLTGRLVRPGFFTQEKGGNDSYATFLAKDEIFSVMYDPRVVLVQKGVTVDGWSGLYALKVFLKERIEVVFPQPAAGLVGGVLLGLRRGISADVMADFSTAGLTHILAISGYNITLLITLFGCALKSAGRRARFWTTLTGIVVFALLTGLSASVIRASLMGTLVIFSMYAGRKSAGLRALFISGGLMVFMNPWIVIADISFQLSFLATLGLLVFMPRWEPFVEKLPSFIGEALVVTLAAQVFTTPVILMNFERFSIISPLANLLFLPFIPLIMFSSFVALVSSFLWLPWTPVWVGMTWLLSTILIEGVHLLSIVPLASVVIENFTLGMGGVYYVLVGLWLWRKRI